MNSTSSLRSNMPDAAQPDVDGSAVAGLRHDTDLVAALGAQRGGVAEQRVQPRDPPRRLRVRRGEDLKAPGRVDDHHVPAGAAAPAPSPAPSAPAPQRPEPAHPGGGWS